MEELTTRQHRLQLLIIAGLLSVVAVGSTYLPPDDYQPSRPIYAAAWLVASAATYLWLRPRRPFAASVALRPAVGCAILFVFSLFM